MAEYSGPAYREWEDTSYRCSWQQSTIFGGMDTLKHCDMTPTTPMTPRKGSDVTIRHQGELSEFSYYEPGPAAIERRLLDMAGDDSSPTYATGIKNTAKSFDETSAYMRGSRGAMMTAGTAKKSDFTQRRRISTTCCTVTSGDGRVKHLTVAVFARIVEEGEPIDDGIDLSQAKKWAVPVLSGPVRGTEYAQRKVRDAAAPETKRKAAKRDESVDTKRSRSSTNLSAAPKARQVHAKAPSGAETTLGASHGSRTLRTASSTGTSYSAALPLRPTYLQTAPTQSFQDEDQSGYAVSQQQSTGPQLLYPNAATVTSASDPFGFLDISPSANEPFVPPAGWGYPQELPAFDECNVHLDPSFAFDFNLDSGVEALPWQPVDPDWYSQRPQQDMGQLPQSQYQRGGGYQSQDLVNDQSQNGLIPSQLNQRGAATSHQSTEYVQRQRGYHDTSGSFQQEDNYQRYGARDQASGYR